MDSVREQIASFIRFSAVTAGPHAEIVTRSVEDGYTRALVRYGTPDGDSIEAFVFEPTRSAPMGCVLALHQHNSQWGIGKSEVAGLMGDPVQAFGPALALRGLRVLAPDAIGFESRQGVPGSGVSLAPRLTKSGSSSDGWLQYYNQMAHRLVRGDLLITKMLADCTTALSVARDDYGPDGLPLGVVGHSLGGVLALFLGALDTRVAFTCSSGAVGSFRHKLANGTGLEMSLVIPRFVERFDLDDLIRCIAPRHLLVVSSDEDRLSEDAPDVVRRARPTFEADNCTEHLQHLHVPGAHALDQSRFSAIVEWIVERDRAASGRLRRTDRKEF